MIIELKFFLTVILSMNLFLATGLFIYLYERRLSKRRGNK